MAERAHELALSATESAFEPAYRTTSVPRSMPRERTATTVGAA